MKRSNKRTVGKKIPLQHSWHLRVPFYDYFGAWSVVGIDNCIICAVQSDSVHIFGTWSNIHWQHTNVPRIAAIVADGRQVTGEDDWSGRIAQTQAIAICRKRSGLSGSTISGTISRIS